jgi:hypothetical protein
MACHFDPERSRRGEISTVTTSFVDSRSTNRGNDERYFVFGCQSLLFIICYLVIGIWYLSISVSVVLASILDL